jgi:hypothetical protein
MIRPASDLLADHRDEKRHRADHIRGGEKPTAGRAASASLKTP